ncbi:MAG: substrate-binding domain-containing protein [Halanaerobiales bacterium]|nr:substrate-binding domain-containing protein [Halanaerobiales bacterium]
MFNIKKMFKVILLFSIIVTLFSFCVNANERLKIAFIPKSLDNPIFLDTFEAAQKTADRLDVILEWVAPFETSTKGQVKIINNLIKQNVDGIIISANNSESLKTVINEAFDKGIPVVTFDSDSYNSERLTYVGTDNYLVGSEMGNSLLNILKEQGKIKNQQEIMILSGVKGASNLKNRIEGFINSINENIKVKEVDIVYCDDNIQLAIELVEEYLKNNMSTDIVFFAGGWPFYAPADAMPNFKKWADQGGIAVGIDIFYSALILQKEGLIDYLIGQDFKNMGIKSLEIIVDFIKDKKEPKEFIDTGYTISNKDNIDHLLKIYKPWEVR